MAELISIDLVLSALAATYNLCDDVRNMPKLIENIQKETKKTKLQVDLLQKKMKDPKSIVHRGQKEIKQMLQEDFSQIIESAKDVRALIQERQQIPWWELGSLLVWVATRKPKFEEITESYDQCRVHIQFVMTTFVHTDANDEQIKLIKENQAILQSLQKLQQDLGAMRKAQWQAKGAPEVKEYQSWTEKNSRRVMDAAIHPDDRTKEQLVDELVKLGLSKQDANAKVGDLLKTIRKEKGRSKSWQYREQAKMKDNVKEEGGGEAEKGASGVNGGNKTNNKPKENNGKKPPASQSASVDGKLEGNAQKAEPASTTQKTRPVEKQGAKTNAKKKFEAKQVHFEETKQQPKTEGTWILFVDWTNGARSIMAQAYMELVRSWTMNTQKRWLFGRVNSCGLGIPTDFNKDPARTSKPDKSPAEEVINAIGGDKSYFWSKDPDEKDTILSRVRSHKSRGIYGTDFYKYKYIVCFDQATRKALESLKEAAGSQNSGKVITTIYKLDGCEAFKTGWTKDQQKLFMVRGSLKVAIKSFLSAELGWIRPLEGIAYGKWRTLQLVVSEEEAARVAGKREALVAVDKLGCAVNMTPEFGGLTCLVSISGPKAKLEDARQVLFGS